MTVITQENAPELGGRRGVKVTVEATVREVVDSCTDADRLKTSTVLKRIVFGMHLEGLLSFETTGRIFARNPEWLHL